ncbi:MAG: sensor histidine kinase [Cytophagales bacterium]|nr:MAG: sensor histidine kinase [Cytophagales bacterium]
MNRRIRTIFWLMTLCIVGVYGFQGYWLWTTYQLNRRQFSQSVQDALAQVMQRQQVAEADRLLSGELSMNTSSEGGQTQVFVRRFNAEEGRIRVFVDERAKKAEIPGKATVKAPADTLARRISGLLLNHWAGGAVFDLSKLRTAYALELKNRGINAPFRLDTLQIRPQKTAENIVIFDTRTTNPNAEGVQTIPMPINPRRYLFAQASFGSPALYLIQRMGWTLGSSLLLLLLTTGCFLLMLNTILRQKKLSEVKNDFINNMTHELKTPIATVAAAVDALQHFGALNDPQKTQTYLTISRNNLQRLADLVEKVLNLAVEEKRELVIHPEPLDLAQLVNDLVTNHQVQAQKSVQFTVAIPATTTVSVDRVHFSNALNNLIDNAINYSGEQVSVRLGYQARPNGWQFTVADTGIGIPTTYQTAIFDRFFRVPTGNLHPVKGFGLGLAYVRQVVERHGGQVAVRSEPGKGSEFILTF